MCSQIRDIRFGLNAALSPVQSKDSQRESLKPVTTCNVPVCDILSYRSNYTVGGSSQLQQLTGFFLRLFFFYMWVIVSYLLLLHLWFWWHGKRKGVYCKPGVWEMGWEKSVVERGVVEREREREQLHTSLTLSQIHCILFKMIKTRQVEYIQGLINWFDFDLICPIGRFVFTDKTLHISDDNWHYIHTNNKSHT